MLRIWFICIIFTVGSNCMNDEQFIPDLTLLSRKINNTQFEYICVAGNNIKDSALIFYTKKNENIRSEFRRFDKHSYKIEKEEYDCDFENNNNCSEMWIRGNSHKIQSTENFTYQKIAPVIDGRWERFELHYSKPNTPVKVPLNGESLTFSLRSIDGSSFVLLDSDYNSMNFYYIEINSALSVFKCDGQDMTKIKLDKCEKIQSHNAKINLKVWQHFSIVINRSIAIYYYDRNEKKVIDFENELGNINAFKLMQKTTTNPGVYFKIHKYNFLSLDETKKSFQLGQYLKPRKANNKVCVEFYALACGNCSIEFSLNDDIKQTIEGDPQQQFQSWQFVRLLTDEQNNNRLKVKNLNQENPQFWAIDDIRLCHENEYKVLSLKTTKERNISCQSLKHSELIVSKKNDLIEYDEYISEAISCFDQTKPKNNCNTLCQVATDNHSCEKYAICKRFNKTESMCSCAFGYTGRYCENKIILPYLRDPVVLVKSTMNSITVHLNSTVIEEQGNFNIISFGIEYKEKYSITWIPTHKKYLLSTNENITISNLKFKTEYSIRGVLYSPEDTFAQEENIRVAHFTTICRNVPDFIKNVAFVVGETNVTVTWTPNCENLLSFQINCHKNGINDKWCRDSKPKNLIGIKSSSNKRFFQGLSPFTKYVLVVKNEKDDIITESFTTKASEQTAVQNLTVYSLTNTSISIRWRRPQINRTVAYYQRFHKNCYKDVTKHFNSISNEIVDCEIWPDWLCHTIYRYFNSNCYKIYVRAFYEDLAMPGYETNVEIKTDTASSPPENITFNLTTSTICWNHPNFVQGLFNRFNLVIEQINSLLITKEFETFFDDYTPQTRQLEYCYDLNTKLELSSSYELRIQTQSTASKSKNKTLLVDTEPVTPELMSDITLGKRAESTQEIIIPQITSKTITSNSVIHVQVCNEENIEKNENIGKFDNLTNCRGLSWIAADFSNPNHENKLIIGNSSKNGNLPLNHSLSYNVHVILINGYKGREIYKIYSKKIDCFENVHEWNPLYLLLLLLLFIPIIAFFVYKKTQNKFLIPPLIGSNVRRSEDNNILPLSHFEENNSVRTPLIKNEKTEVPVNKFSRIVKVENLSQYVKDSLESGELQRQHNLFKNGGTKPWKYGMTRENLFKNRYKNLTAYDHSRVILNEVRGDPFSDFINANYINGYNQKNAYIATQGPKLNTLNDFWRMIWQENVKYIVMLANLTEGGKKKCDKYWPEEGATQEYGDLSVIYLKSDIYADFEYRTFEVANGAKKRKVQQLHFTSWPDHGVPLYPQSLVPFLKKMTTIPVDEAPIVVHCSAGVGRTGTIILTDICLRMAAAEAQIDALKYLQTIRENRANMVDNFSQYKLVHMVLLEYLLAPKTNIPCDESMTDIIENLIETGKFQKELEYLETTAWHNKAITTIPTVHPENYSKNRFPLIVPGNTRIFISRYPYDDENSDYINAIPVDGFHIKDQFIVTQNPLPNTLKDFWRMVNEYNCKIIVSLNEFESNDENCKIFWPAHNEEVRPMPHLIIKNKAEQTLDYYDVIKVQMTNQNAEEGNETSTIKIIQFKNWQRDSHLPQNPISLINLFEEGQSSSRDGNPMIVTCFDGTTASGVFVALSFVIEKIKLEQICDVSLATRIVRCNRHQFIVNWDQYVFLYKAALEYVNSFKEYANFQGPSILNQ